MAIGSGLGSQLGIGKEVTWGTAVAATTFLPVGSFNLKRQGNKVQGQGIRAGGYGPLSGNYAETHEGSTGSFSFEAPTAGWDHLFQNFTGATPTPSIVTGSIYSATFPIGDNFGKGITIEGGIPQQDGTVQRHRLAGGKVTSMEFSCSVGGLLMCSVEVDGKQTTNDATAVSTASYATDLSVFPWNSGAFKINNTALTGVREWSIRISRPYDTERYSFGGGGTKLEQIPNGFVEVSGSVTVDLLNSTLLGYVTGDTAVDLDIEFDRTVNAKIYELDIVVPTVRFQDYDVPVTGPDTVKQTFNFVGQWSGTGDMLSLRRANTGATVGAG
jgi:hypothetical protein